MSACGLIRSLMNLFQEKQLFVRAELDSTLFVANYNYPFRWSTGSTKDRFG